MKKILSVFISVLSVLSVSSCGNSKSDYKSPEAGVLKYVQSGRFYRGTGADSVTAVSGFHIAEHEVTRELFQKVMGSDPSDLRFSEGTDCPVQNVNWYMAVAFCNKLSLIEKLKPVYAVEGVDFSKLKFEDIPAGDNAAWNSVTADWSADGYRLPTESEWQWAAMGAKNARTKTFAGSDGNNSAVDYAWYYENSGNEILLSPWNWADVEKNRNKVHAVGTRKPNELGLYDMSGNVWELCWDLYGHVPEGGLDDYRGAAKGSQRTYRGGGWFDGIEYLRLDQRYIINPEIRQYNTGFRLVRN